MVKLDGIFRRANRLAQNMKNGEVRSIPGSRINGSHAVVYKARQNGMINVLGANSNNQTISRFFSDGRQRSISKDAMKEEAKKWRKKKLYDQEIFNPSSLAKSNDLK